MLEERGRSWQERFPRLGSDLPPRERDLGAEGIQEVELWDLVSAFGRMMRDSAATRPSNIVYDETPIEVYMTQIKSVLAKNGRLAFRDLFVQGMHKSALIGIFLAVLELVRHRQARAEQNQLFGELWILPGPDGDAPLDALAVERYDHGGASR
jgi:segregation and condensation protein A